MALDEQDAQAGQRLAAPADGRPVAVRTPGGSTSAPSSSCVRAKRASTSSAVMAPLATSGCQEIPARIQPSCAWRRMASRAPGRSTTSSGERGVRAPQRLARTTPSYQKSERAPLEARPRAGARRARRRRARTLRPSPAAPARGGGGRARPGAIAPGSSRAAALHLLRPEQPAVARQHALDDVDLRVLQARLQPDATRRARRAPRPPRSPRCGGAREVRVVEHDAPRPAASRASSAGRRSARRPPASSRLRRS